MDTLSLLREGELSIEGRLTVASNLTLRGHVTHGDRTVRCVYKPISGERPLWDFPTGTLARREVAAYELAEAAGWRHVPPTVLREQGPFGPGMCQQWIDAPDGAVSWVDVVAPAEVEPGWHVVLEAMDDSGAPVVLVHADTPDLRRLALFDVVVNNADRKGGHVLAAPATVGRTAIFGVDHGVCFHPDPKLRTVLWGWSGEAITASERAELVSLREALGRDLGHTLNTLLSGAEVAATSARIDELLTVGRFPHPTGRMPVPWPVF